MLEDETRSLHRGAHDLSQFSRARWAEIEARALLLDGSLSIGAQNCTPNNSESMLAHFDNREKSSAYAPVPGHMAR
jgi:hypothetical protein